MQTTYTYDVNHTEIHCGDWVYTTLPITHETVVGHVVVPQHSQCIITAVFDNGTVRVEVPMAIRDTPRGSVYEYSLYGTHVGSYLLTQEKYKKDTDTVSIRPNWGGYRR